MALFFRSTAALSLSFIMLCNVALSQDATTGGLEIRDMLNEAVEALANDSGLPEEQRERLDNMLNTVSKNVDRAAKFEQLALEIRQAAESAPDMIAGYKLQPIEAKEQEYALADILPGQLFVRIHRSYLVSINKIDAIQRQSVIINGETLPVGASYKKHFLYVIEKGRLIL